MPTGNRLLDALPPVDAAEIAAAGRVVRLRRDDCTSLQDRPMSCVDFPISALMTVQGQLEDGTVFEVASVGPEGFVEVDAALHAEVALRNAACQFEGEVLRLSLDDFRRWLRRSEPFAMLVAQAVRARIHVTEQLTMCNLRHSIVQRFARWLLVACDRLNRSDFDVTHEFVATILGVRRAGVTSAGGQLERDGALAMSRGLVTIADSDRLKAASCECYVVCRDVIEASVVPSWR
ncbi:MAG TPA: Crp/Fnr family transcriptional regulator [Candidatus Baltobacteraceae bacterium]|nr:Crp/Fnr family transcriptional regulator [Candidatus Baltobacteraceae bacterium]